MDTVSLTTVFYSELLSENIGQFYRKWNNQMQVYPIILN